MKSPDEQMMAQSIILTFPRPGTSHIVAADHTGLAISAITTINLLFGSRLMVPETGIIMNNEMNGTEASGALVNHI